MSFENQIKEILKARLEGTATEEELAILREWLDRSPQNRELAELLEESAENLPLLGRIYGYDEQRVWGNIRKAARRRHQYNRITFHEEINCLTYLRFVSLFFHNRILI